MEAKMKKHLALVLVMALLAASVPAVAAAPSTRAKAWTYLVYIGADNNLDIWGDFSLDLMKTGLTSDQDVSVAVLDDHYGAGAELLQVTSAGVVKLADYGEPDMGNPETLRQFLSWGIKAFPADHYAVVIWDHGGGWKYIIKDDTSGSRMSIAGLASAMNSAAVELGRGRKFDITVFDACLMSLVEVADQLTPVTDYVVASEQSVNSTGFPYDLMLQRLVADPSVTSGDYARGIADDYYTFNIQSNSKSVLTVAAIDESKLGPLVSSIDDLSVTLIANMAAFYPDANDARAVAQHLVWGVNGVFWYVDLHRFVDQLALRIADTTLDAQAAAVVDHLGNAIYERHSHNLDGMSYGLGINFPPNLSRYQDKSYLAQNYQDIDLTFTDETHWDEMLLEFYQYQE
jgi:Clostripain family